MGDQFYIAYGAFGGEGGYLVPDKETSTRWMELSNQLMVPSWSQFHKKAAKMAWERAKQAAIYSPETLHLDFWEGEDSSPWFGFWDEKSQSSVIIGADGYYEILKNDSRRVATTEEFADMQIPEKVLQETILLLWHIKVEETAPPTKWRHLVGIDPDPISGPISKGEKLREWARLLEDGQEFPLPEWIGIHKGITCP